MNNITGRIALITEGIGGLGPEIANALAKEGTDVALGYRDRRQSEIARELAATISSSYGVRTMAVRGDASKWGDVDDMIWAIESELGDVGILVNNAGTNLPASLNTITQETWDRTLADNLTAVFSMTQRVLPGMRKAQFGRLIMILGAAPLGGMIAPHYAASKAGLLGLMHSYASLLANEGISANAIAPALVKTDMLESNRNITPGLLHLKQFGQPREIAEIAVTLARNGCTTGQTIHIKGGWPQSQDG